MQCLILYPKDESKMFIQNTVLIFKKPAHCNILKNTPLRSKCRHDNLKSYSKIILCKMCKFSYNCLPINQKYFMTFSTKNYYNHRACMCIKKPLSLKKLKNPTRNVVFVGPIIFLY